MQYLILLAGRIGDRPVRADHRRLFMLCWTARAPDVLITPFLLNNTMKTSRHKLTAFRAGNRAGSRSRNAHLRSSPAQR